jgi:hypothetical protein
LFEGTSGTISGGGDLESNWKDFEVSIMAEM